MFKSNIDINDNYFYMPFGPVVLKPEDVGLKYSLLLQKYVKVDNETKWRKRLLYNTGWGQPYGYERLPELRFDDLLKLAFLSDHKTTLLTIREEESNKYGAIAIIMEKHISELIRFLAENINNDDLWENHLYKKNLKLFCFDQKYANGNGGIGFRSYEEILNNYPEWKSISQTVKELIY